MPRNTTTGVVNYAADAGNDAGKRTNRGFEGLAISPDGRYVYAMLQSAMLDEGGRQRVFNRIVKFSYLTGRAVAQYAYRMEGCVARSRYLGVVCVQRPRAARARAQQPRSRRRGRSRGPNKKVFRIDLKGATDVSGIDLDAPGALFTPVTKETGTPWLDLALPATLAHPSLAALNGVSPEKWEGLAVGPKLADGSYLVLAGTDNDYSVTQIRRRQARRPCSSIATSAGAYGTVERIQCDIGTFNNCFAVNANGTLGAPCRRGSMPQATSSCRVCCMRTKRRRRIFAGSLGSVSVGSRGRSDASSSSQTS